MENVESERHCLQPLMANFSNFCREHATLCSRALWVLSSQYKMADIYGTKRISLLVLKTRRDLQAELTQHFDEIGHLAMLQHGAHSRVVGGGGRVQRVGRSSELVQQLL
jgi:hypothetical protein